MPAWDSAIGRGILPEAIAAWTPAIALRPDFARAHWNKSVAQLLPGISRRVGDYEWRKRHDRFARDFFNLPAGMQAKPWKAITLLVPCQQGLGDTIQFPVFSSAGGTWRPCGLACASPLIPLLADMPGARHCAKDAA